MLQLGDVVIKNDEYYIKKMFTGIDELFFDISIWDEHYPLIAEEASILETERGQTYLVKAIDGGGSTAQVRCLIDLDDFYGTITVPYTNGSATLASTVSMPSGWTFTDSSASSITRTIELPSATPMDILNQCRDTYGVIFRFDNKLKTVTAYNPDGGSFAGAFMTRDLNLKEINYKGASTDIITALYCVGKDGLTFASINGGNAYITNGSYKNKLIWGYWKDERYTDAASLLADATAKLAQLSVPTRSYQCDVVDLSKTNPDLYAHQDFDLLKVVDLVDDSRGVTIRNKVVEYVDYPYYPEKNVVTISTTTPNIHVNVKQINVSLNNPNSTFQQVTTAAQASATKQILSGGGGYVVMNTNAEDLVTEILIMDTNDIATATKVWRWNTAGLGYSSTGYNGTYTTAITQDGAIVADFITTGTLNASEINVINLIANHVKSEYSTYIMELNAAIFTLYDGIYTRVSMFSSPVGTGVIRVNSGNSTEEEMLDDDARMTTVAANYIIVGADRNNVRHGAMYCQDVIATNLNITAVRPLGNNLLNVDWRLVRMADGTTAYALCQKL